MTQEEIIIVNNQAKFIEKIVYALSNKTVSKAFGEKVLSGAIRRILDILPVWDGYITINYKGNDWTIGVKDGEGWFQDETYIISFRVISNIIKLGRIDKIKDLAD